MRHLSFAYNGIQTIADTFFSEMENLQYLSLGGNLLTTITPELMEPLTGLRLFYVYSNRIEALNTRTFRTNRQLVSMSFKSNRINAIGEGIFDDLRALEFIGLIDNQCVDDNFGEGGITSIENVDEELQICYNNTVRDPPRRRQVVFELRGNMTLQNDDGSTIVNYTGRSWF
jgi:Leucine-rich repeat (LRR) protein